MENDNQAEVGSIKNPKKTKGVWTSVNLLGKLETAPVFPKEGDMYIDTLESTDGVMRGRIFNNEQWSELIEMS